LSTTVRHYVSLGTSIAIIALDTGAYQSGWVAIDRCPYPK